MGLAGAKYREWAFSLGCRSKVPGNRHLTIRSSTRPVAAGRPLRGAFVATPRSPLCSALCTKGETMSIKDDWGKVKAVLEQGQASTLYCSIATVNPDGTPHITPVGTVFLGEDQRGYFFDHYAQALGSNIDQNRS